MIALVTSDQGQHAQASHRKHSLLAGQNASAAVPAVVPAVAPAVAPAVPAVPHPHAKHEGHSAHIDGIAASAHKAAAASPTTGHGKHVVDASSTQPHASHKKASHELDEARIAAIVASAQQAAAAPTTTGSAAGAGGGASGTASSSTRWLLVLGVVVLALCAEEAAMSSLDDVSMRTASIWLGGFGGACALVLLALVPLEGSSAPPLYASIMLINVALSPDNLVVFMMFLQHAQLPRRHHRRVISDGLLFAVALRLSAMLATSKLLAAFSSLQMLLAVAVLAKGVQMVLEAWLGPRCEGKAAAAEPPPNAADHWAVRSLQRFVPIRWDDDTDGVCLARGADESGGSGLYVTRTTALVVAIGCSDLTFSSDNIASVLAISTDAFVVVTTMTLSMLLLRPLYFLAAGAVDYADTLDGVLGVVLVLIGGKLCLAQLGVEVPLALVVGLLTAWRVAAAAYVLCRRRRRAVPVNDEEDEVEEAEPDHDAVLGGGTAAGSK